MNKSFRANFSNPCEHKIPSLRINLIEMNSLFVMEKIALCEKLCIFYIDTGLFFILHMNSKGTGERRNKQVLVTHNLTA